ncbi:uncharacterized protein EAE97_010965 [Botrytis byssoidea]|uniref:Cupin type-1 domain-containing protein n=1 Tax=Botrytis byssoidea TaxID=139641 RepID=A0A9P5HTV8_9HELO|nr:uncharacterized protein EAE97_010965 [Botrytis byssoidea]KAF7922801.1 hypothetical protein EAE97_010965 [Botrytis byssoidea]
MYTHPHFHSSTHEVLCIFSGSARLCFSTPTHTPSSKIQATVKFGDVIIIPAGISHHLLEDLTGDFQMIGSYPKGKTWDMCYGDGSSGEEEKIRGIADLEWFDRDPLYGDQGPVLEES